MKKTNNTASVNASSKKSQLSKIHEDLVVNGRAVLGNDETFGEFRAECSYSVFDIPFKVLEVVTNGKGNHTLFKLVREDTNEKFEGDIDDVKRFFGVTFKKKYNTTGNKNPFFALYNTLRTEDFSAKVERTESEEVKKKWKEFYGLCHILGKELQITLDKQKEEEDAKKKVEDGILKIMEEFGATREEAERMYKFRMAKKAKK